MYEYFRDRWQYVVQIWKLVEDNIWCNSFFFFFLTVPTAETKPRLSSTTSWGSESEGAGSLSRGSQIYFSAKARLSFRHQLDSNINAVDATYWAKRSTAEEANGLHHTTRTELVVFNCEPWSFVSVKYWELLEILTLWESQRKTDCTRQLNSKQRGLIIETDRLMRGQNIVVYSFLTNKCITLFHILQVFYSAFCVLKVFGGGGHALTLLIRSWLILNLSFQTALMNSRDFNIMSNSN